MSCFRYIEIRSPAEISDETGTTVGGGISSFSVYTQPFAAGVGSPLVWIENGGEVPSDIAGRFRVYEDGRKLEYANEFTVDTSPTTSANVTITYYNPSSYYWIEATFINGS